MRCDEIEEVDGIEPDCENCDLPPLSSENSEIVDLYNTINTQFVYDFHALPLVFELYSVQCTRGEAKGLLKKLTMIHGIKKGHERENRKREIEARRKR